MARPASTPPAAKPAKPFRHSCLLSAAGLGSATLPPPARDLPDGAPWSGRPRLARRCGLGDPGTEAREKQSRRASTVLEAGLGRGVGLAVRPTHDGPFASCHTPPSGFSRWWVTGLGRVFSHSLGREQSFLGADGGAEGRHTTTTGFLLAPTLRPHPCAGAGHAGWRWQGRLAARLSRRRMWAFWRVLRPVAGLCRGLSLGLCMRRAA